MNVNKKFSLKELLAEEARDLRLNKDEVNFLKFKHLKQLCSKGKTRKEKK